MCSDIMGIEESTEADLLGVMTKRTSIAGSSSSLFYKFRSGTYQSLAEILQLFIVTVNTGHTWTHISFGNDSRQRHAQV